MAERRACRRESTLSRAASLKAEAQARRARAASKQAAKEATEREANAVRPVIDEADGAPGEGDDGGEVTVDEIMNFKSPPPPEATAPRRTLLCIDDDVSGGNGGSVPPSPALLPIRELKRRLASRGVAQARFRERRAPRRRERCEDCARGSYHGGAGAQARLRIPGG